MEAFHSLLQKKVEKTWHAITLPESVLAHIISCLVNGGSEEVVRPRASHQPAICQAEDSSKFPSCYYIAN